MGHRKRLKKLLKNGSQNRGPQSAVITKVIVCENDSYNIVGSGYAIIKADGYSRLDAQDLNGNHLEVGYYNVHENGETKLAFTTDRIQ